MRVKLKTTYAKAGLAAQAGAIIKVPDDEGRDLIAGGYAEEVTSDEGARTEVDAQGARELRAGKGGAGKGKSKGAAAAAETATIVPDEVAVVVAEETEVVAPPEEA